MKLNKSLKHAFDMVVHSKLRSWLTILGIVIGVAAVIAIVSLGQGLQASVNSQLGNLGSNLLTISPGFSRGQFFGGGGRMIEFGGGGKASSKSDTLTRNDVQVIRGSPYVNLIDTEISGSVTVSYLSQNGTARLTGVDPSIWSHVTTSVISQGRMLDSADSNVIVIGGGLSSNYFKQPLGLNQVLTIENTPFRVVGILNDSSNSIYMPIPSAYNVIPNHDKNIYDTLIVQMKDDQHINESMADITQRLDNERHVTSSTQDFTIISNAEIAAARSSALSTLSTFLIAIAAVSLIVGAVGVANTMFTSVLEKTREIGIMKAIGARNRDILMIFLLNSALIGLVGGVLGIILGILLSGLIPAVLGISVLDRGGTIVSISSIILAVVVSLLVGIVAGMIPAYKASKLKPVDALRFD